MPSDKIGHPIGTGERSGTQAADDAWRLAQLNLRSEVRPFFYAAIKWIDDLIRLYKKAGQRPPFAASLAKELPGMLESRDPERRRTAIAFFPYLGAEARPYLGHLRTCMVNYPEHTHEIQRSIGKWDSVATETADVGYTVEDFTGRTIDGSIRTEADVSEVGRSVSGTEIPALHRDDGVSAPEKPPYGLPDEPALSAPLVRQPSSPAQSQKQVDLQGQPGRVATPGMESDSSAALTFHLEHIDVATHRAIWACLQDANASLPVDRIGPMLARAPKSLPEAIQIRIWQALNEGGLRLSISEIVSILDDIQPPSAIVEVRDRLREIQQQGIRHIQTVLAGVGGTSFGSLEKNRAAVNAIQAELNRLSLRAICPKCRRPALLRWRAVGNAKQGGLQFEHNKGASQKYHSFSSEFPPFINIEPVEERQ